MDLRKYNSVEQIDMNLISALETAKRPVELSGLATDGVKVIYDPYLKGRDFVRREKLTDDEFPYAVTGVGPLREYKSFGQPKRSCDITIYVGPDALRTGYQRSPEERVAFLQNVLVHEYKHVEQFKPLQKEVLRTGNDALRFDPYWSNKNHCTHKDAWNAQQLHPSFNRLNKSDKLEFQAGFKESAGECVPAITPARPAYLKDQTSPREVKTPDAGSFLHLLRKLLTTTDSTKTVTAHRRLAKTSAPSATLHV
ncbi:MAG: hypothetical protein ACR2IE_17870 [Candidatus Sumerlaeaceae bacterium]